MLDLHGSGMGCLCTCLSAQRHTQTLCSPLTCTYTIGSLSSTRSPSLDAGRADGVPPTAAAWLVVAPPSAPCMSRGEWLGRCVCGKPDSASIGLVGIATQAADITFTVVCWQRSLDHYFSLQPIIQTVFCCCCCCRCCYCCIGVYVIYYWSFKQLQPTECACGSAAPGAAWRLNMRPTNVLTAFFAPATAAMLAALTLTAAGAADEAPAMSVQDEKPVSWCLLCFRWQAGCMRRQAPSQRHRGGYCNCAVIVHGSLSLPPARCCRRCYIVAATAAAAAAAAAVLVLLSPSMLLLLLCPAAAAAGMCSPD